MGGDWGWVGPATVIQGSAPPFSTTTPHCPAAVLEQLRRASVLALEGTQRAGQLLFCSKQVAKIFLVACSHPSSVDLSLLPFGR